MQEQCRFQSPASEDNEDWQAAVADACSRTMLVARFDLGGRFMSANGNFLALLGYSLDDLRGWHHRRLCDPAHAASSDYQACWERVARGEPFSGRYPRRARDGRTVWLDLTCVPLLDASGRPEAVMEIARDASREERRVADLRRLSQVVEHSQNAIVVLDPAQRILYVNDSFTRLCGVGRSTVAGRRLADVIPLDPAYRESGLRVLDDLTSRGGHDELMIRGPSGEPCWVSLVTTPVAGGMNIIMTDSSHIKRREFMQRRVVRLLLDERPLGDIAALICREVERLMPGVYATVMQRGQDDRLRVIAAPSFFEGYARMVGAFPVGPDAACSGRAAYLGEPVLAQDVSRDPGWDALRDVVRRTGMRSCWSVPILHTDGRVLGTFALHSRDVLQPGLLHKDVIELSAQLCALGMEREESRARMRHLASYDGLTGLPRRNLFDERAALALDEAGRARRMLAMIFIDLDRFRRVNESHGYMAGDALLRAVGQRLRRLAGAAELCSRLSGDEFLVLLPVADRADLQALAVRVRGALTGPVQAGEVRLEPAASLGIALYPEHGRQLDALVRNADAAARQAKTGGAERYCIYEAREDRSVLCNALEAALDAGDQLMLVYQPQVGLRGGEVLGVEALVRWRHPELGVIPPDRFVPLAESSGLIGRLGDWILNRACGQLAAWRRQGLAIPAVSVNLSPIDFQSADLPERIRCALSRHGLSPGDLSVELTEGVIMDVTPVTMATVAAVDALGVRLSVDDFGTGYASLAQLRRIPVSELKIDRSFVRDVEHDPVARSLVRTVVDMASNLDLVVVAEGVETLGQRSFLEQCGCTVAQGYLYAPGLPPDELADWVRQRGLR